MCSAPWALLISSYLKASQTTYLLLHVGMLIHMQPHWYCDYGGILWQDKTDSSGAPVSLNNRKTLIGTIVCLFFLWEVIYSSSRPPKKSQNTHLFPFMLVLRTKLKILYSWILSYKNDYVSLCFLHRMKPEILFRNVTKRKVYTTNSSREKRFANNIGNLDKPYLSADMNPQPLTLVWPSFFFFYKRVILRSLTPKSKAVFSFRSELKETMTSCA